MQSSLLNHPQLQQRRASLMIIIILSLFSALFRPAVDLFSPDIQARVADHFEGRSDLFIHLYWRDLSSSYGRGFDPWGKEWIYETKPDPKYNPDFDTEPQSRLVVRKYSLGPNGVDEQGQGDDVVVYRHGQGYQEHWQLAYVWLPDSCFALAMLVLVARFGVWLLTSPRSSSRGEIFRALALSWPLSIVAVAALVIPGLFFFEWSMTFFSLLENMELCRALRLHPFVVVGIFLYFLVFLMILHYRRLAVTPSHEDARRCSLAEAALIGCALAFIAHAPIIKPLWTLLSPRMAAVQAYEDGLSTDPWGRKWSGDKALMDGWTWSMGPNGKDEGGKGDDVIVDRGYFTQPPENKIFLDSPLLLICAATLLTALSSLYFRGVIPYLHKEEMRLRLNETAAKD